MDMVLKEVCKKQTEKFDAAHERADARLREAEQFQRELLKLSAQMTELLKRCDGQLGEHEARLAGLEKRPGIWLDRIAAAAISAFVTALLALLL